jgi:tRNA-dihydrouridine synthase B
MLKMRTFVPRYVRHIPGVRALRNRLASCLDRALLEELLETHLTPQAFAEDGDSADTITTVSDGESRP